MAGNSNLSAAVKAKKDEFYTQLTDIEKEMRHYRKHFQGKTVFCNCDDPFESNFFKYFVLNFNRLGLEKLIATCYFSSPVAGQQLQYFENSNGQLSFGFGDTPIEPDCSKRPYKAIVTQVYDKTGDGGVDMVDIAELFKSGENQLTELEGNGDFRSQECLKLLDDADIVVTNPPFSLFREFVTTLIQKNKHFIILGNVNAITYKEFFPLLKDNKVWIGASIHSGDRKFYVPDDYPLNAAGCGIDEDGRRFIRVKGVRWFTNLDIKQRHEEMILVKRYSPEQYAHFDNYDAINVDATVDIPCDYAGMMGVPITFMDKYNPDQFEIIGVTQSWCGIASKIYPKQIQIDKSGKRSQVTKLNDGAAIKVDVPPANKTYYDVDGDLFIKTYARVIIRNKYPEQPREVQR